MHTHVYKYQVSTQYKMLHFHNKSVLVLSQWESGWKRVMPQEEWGDFLGTVCSSLIGCLLNPSALAGSSCPPVPGGLRMERQQTLVPLHKRQRMENYRPWWALRALLVHGDREPAA